MAKTYCDKCNITHTPLMCFYKPRKRIRQDGKAYHSWQDTRNLWLTMNPPDKHGYWYCTLNLPGCLVKIDIDQLTLDHIISRSHAPSLRYDLTNLQASCIFCNSKKGSRSDFRESAED